MAARQEMRELIDTVREFIGDDPDKFEFSDDQIIARLDQNRRFNSKKALVGLDGEPASLFDAKTLFWDKDARFVDGRGTTIVPEEKSNWMAGHFYFASAYSGVAISGWSYDVYKVCSDLLILWAGHLDPEINKFSADGSSYEFESSRANKLKMAEQFSAKSVESSISGGIQVIKRVRND